MSTIGDRIKSLRKERNLKQGELAKILRMTSAQLCRIELAKNAPSVKTLARIARALGVTLSELMGCNIEEGRAPIACSSDDERAYPSSGDCVNLSKEALVPIRKTNEPSEELDSIVHQVETRLRQYETIENELGIPVATTLPLCFSYALDERGAEMLSVALRSCCDAGSVPFADLPGLLESRNVCLVNVKTSPEIQSRSFFDTHNRVLAIAVNSKLLPERQIYRIAYEIGYACLFASSGFSTVVEVPGMHRFVRRFAAAFLMPEQAVRTLASQLALGPGNWTFPMLLQLKVIFGVTAETFAHRLEKIGTLAPALRKRFKEELRNYYEEHADAEPKPNVKPLQFDSRLSLLKLRAAK